jgi:hypothetical protein
MSGFDKAEYPLIDFAAVSEIVCIYNDIHRFIPQNGAPGEAGRQGVFIVGLIMGAEPVNMPVVTLVPWIMFFSA